MFTIRVFYTDSHFLSLNYTSQSSAVSAGSTFIKGGAVTCVAYDFDFPIEFCF